MKLMHRLVALKVLRLQSPRANESHNAMLLQGTMDSTCERFVCCYSSDHQCVKAGLKHYKRCCKKVRAVLAHVRMARYRLPKSRM